MRTKIVLLMSVGALLVPAMLRAQVDKRVEVSKAYVPDVEASPKLAMRPDRTDTVKLRPEIDYSITPLAYATPLEVRPIRPAKVTYWEFNRPEPFYLKLGAGYPLNSAADFYVSTQHPDIGYAVGYLNHEGRFAKIRNDAHISTNSTRMFNRVGAAAGRYVGRRTIEAAASYDNRLYHRYGAMNPVINEFEQELLGSRIDYGEGTVRLRLGDDFTDLGRFNFDLSAYGTYFYDDNEEIPDDNRFLSNYPANGSDDRQIDAGGALRMGRRFGRHTLRFAAGFDGVWGKGDLDGRTIVSWNGSLRYAYAARAFDLEAGVDYVHSSIGRLELKLSETKVKENFNYILPFLRLRFDLGGGALTPFAEIDGRMHDNSFRTLSAENPYLYKGIFGMKNTVAYNLRVGAAGSLFGSRFSYRVFLEFKWMENEIYWYGFGLDRFLSVDTKGYRANPFWFDFVQARRTVTSIQGELDWRPTGNLQFRLDLKGYRYNNRAWLEGKKLCGGRPAFEGAFKIDYRHRKFSMGASARVLGVRYFSVYMGEVSDSEGVTSHLTMNCRIPVTIDVGAYVDWHLSRRVTIFAEGRNLANQKLYEWPGYPELGANFTAGVKLTF